jgi:hypothetical protein
MFRPPSFAFLHFRVKSGASRKMLRFLTAAGVALHCALSLPAQELREQPTPFSIWLDFHALSAPNPPHIALPIWLESVRTEYSPAREGVSETTVYRLHFRRVGELNSTLQLRLLFIDESGASPSITGWTETGENRFQRGPLGAGLGLPTSETLTLPMERVDYIDIEVPGTGTNVGGVFLASLRKAEALHATDYAPPAEITDAFENLPQAAAKPDDYTLYGRVKAAIDPGTMKLTPNEAPTGSWEFELQSAPLTAVLTFEILNADTLAAPDLIVNNQPLGEVSIHQPDLADPAYIGLVRPLDQDMHFRYAGWLRCQKAIPGSALQPGLNKVVLQLHRESGPVAVRAVEIQLKYNSPTLEYTLAPDKP